MGHDGRVAAPFLFVVLAGALAGGGCDSGPSTFAVTFDPCQGLALAPVASATADELASVDDAVAMWRAVAPVDLSLDAAAEDRPTLPIVFDDVSLYWGRYDDAGQTIEISTEVDDRRARAVVLAHELGHAFGLYHVDPSDRVSVMNKGNAETAPTPADGAALDVVWPDCAR